MDNKISVVCMCNNKYIIMLAVLLKSIEINHKRDKNIDFYILDLGIGKLNRKKIMSSIDSKRVRFIWKTPSLYSFKKLGVKKKDSFIFTPHYYKLLVPYILPKRLNKAIYFDSDLLVLDDIEKLWKKRLNKKIIGAVLDGGVPFFGNEWGISNYKELKLNPNLPYFNSGVMVIDLKRWRKEKVSQKTILYTIKNKNKLVLYEQYGLNIVLIHRWKRLPEEWNHFQYIKDSKKPKIIHFAISSKKPIYRSYNGKYKKLFFNYLNKTAWRGWRP